MSTKTKHHVTRPGGGLGGGGAPPQLGLHEVGLLGNSASNAISSLKSRQTAQFSVSVQETGQYTQIYREKFGPAALAVEELAAGGQITAVVGHAELHSVTDG